MSALVISSLASSKEYLDKQFSKAKAEGKNFLFSVNEAMSSKFTTEISTYTIGKNSKAELFNYLCKKGQENNTSNVKYSLSGYYNLTETNPILIKDELEPHQIATLNNIHDMKFT